MIFRNLLHFYQQGCFPHSTIARDAHVHWRAIRRLKQPTLELIQFRFSSDKELGSSRDLRIKGIDAHICL